MNRVMTSREIRSIEEHIVRINKIDLTHTHRGQVVTMRDIAKYSTNSLKWLKYFGGLKS